MLMKPLRVQISPYVEYFTPLREKYTYTQVKPNPKQFIKTIGSVSLQLLLYEVL